MTIANAINLEAVRVRAQSRLPRVVFDFIDGGADDEIGIAHNIAAFRSLRFVPRYLGGEEACDMSATVFGRQYAMPIGIAPFGSPGLFRRGGDIMLARAASKAAIPYVMSMAATVSIETAAAEASGNMWFQLYPLRDTAVTDDILARANAAGVRQLVVTVDTPSNANRERDVRNGHQATKGLKAGSLGLRTLLDGMIHPAWSLDYLRSGGLPRLENLAPYVDRRADSAALATFLQTGMIRGLTAGDLDRIRKVWPHDLVVKGVMNTAQARQMAQMGCQGLIVSNHGGRQLDRCASPIEVLSPIADAVGDRLTIMLDSGVRRGADVMAALALGARLVFVGRPAAFGIAAGGQEGIDQVMSILNRELALVMKQCGYRDVAAVTNEILF